MIYTARRGDNSPKAEVSVVAKIPKLLSKSKIMRGYQCLKSIYQAIHNKELETPVGPEQQAVFDQGTYVGEVAREQFPGGALIDNKPWDFFGSLSATRDHIKNQKVIYEAAFEYKGCYARVDIITYSEATKRWTIYEVKSTTKVKPEHIDDIGLQAWIIANSGLPIEAIYLMHLNPECTYPDLSNLFAKEDVTEQLRQKYKGIAPKMNEIFSTIRQKDVPDIDIGPHCFVPYECSFKAACWQERKIPEVSVLNLPKFHDKKWDVYNQGIVELTDDRLTGLNEQQQRIVDCVKSGDRFVDKSIISAELSNWQYPLVYLDFETINPAIPRYNGCGPYKQVPFQFSCHVQDEPGAELKHYEYLHTDESDPRDNLIPKLIDACGMEGSIVAYFARFETDRIKEMADQYPQYAEQLTALLDRFVDPLPIFREAVYDNKFKASFSLKYVAPAILGEDESYQGMEVADGGAAQRAFEELINPNTNSTRKTQLEQAMLDYCRKDTLVMVHLVDWLFDQAKA